jgi:hypothetical protein
MTFKKLSIIIPYEVLFNNFLGLLSLFVKYTQILIFNLLGLVTSIFFRDT